jgi:hypothetical protein
MKALASQPSESSQRREAFRVCVPAEGGPRLRLQAGPAGAEPLSLQLLDLSLTGCSAVRPAQQAERLAAAQWKAATLELDASLQLPLRLLAHEVTPQAGPATPWRCSWVLQRPQDEPVLQRWLTQAQQQQRQLERMGAQSAPHNPAPAGAAAAAPQAGPSTAALSTPPSTPHPVR